MNKENFLFNNKLDTKEGRRFIYKAVNFFMIRSIEKAKKRPFKRIEDETPEKLYDKYKFIYNSTIEPDMELCYLLVHVASEYIDYIEETFRAKLQFPFEYDVLFDLESWFEEIYIKNRYTEEIMILLINKLYESPYRKLIMA